MTFKNFVSQHLHAMSDSRALCATILSFSSGFALGAIGMYVLYNQVKSANPTALDTSPISATRINNDDDDSAEQQTKLDENEGYVNTNGTQELNTPTRNGASNEGLTNVESKMGDSQRVQDHVPDIFRLINAVHYCALKHQDQRRKNARQCPYVNHPVSVAQRLCEAGITDIDVLISALLHDTVEDTDATETEIEDQFGKPVAAIVMEVTDDKTLPKQDRKQQQILRAPNSSPSAKLIKLADKLDNLTDLLSLTPIGWPPSRVAEYFDWAERVVDGLRGTNSTLESQLDAVFLSRQVALDTAAENLSS